MSCWGCLSDVIGRRSESITQAQDESEPRFDNPSLEDGFSVRIEHESGDKGAGSHGNDSTPESPQIS